MASGAQSDPAGTRSLIEGLAGVWEGTGTLEYPTIDTAPYREVLTVKVLDGGWPLHYLQQTWKVTPDGEKPSHVETGFVDVETDGAVVILCAQGPDRVEVLRGSPRRTGDDSWQLELTASLHGYDPRMRSARRSASVKGDEIDYTMVMSTGDVPEETLHLRARLTRTGR